MSFLDWFRRKNKASSGPRQQARAPRVLPQPASPVQSARPPSIEGFARQATKSASSLVIQMSAVSELVDNLTNALREQYPNLEPGEAFSHAKAGLTVSCRVCGELGHDAVSILYIAGSSMFGRVSFGGPNVAALWQGRCPRCGLTTVVVKFDPSQAKARNAALSTTLPATTTGPPVKPRLSMPYLASLCVSPSRELAAWVAGRNADVFDIVVTQVGSGSPLTTLRYAAKHPPHCLFAGNDRLLVSRHMPEDAKGLTLTLHDARTGGQLRSIHIPDCYFSYPTVRHDGGAVAAEHGTFGLVIVTVADGGMEYRLVKTGQIYLPGPRFGPDGNLYIISHYALNRLDGDHPVPIMAGDHCICFDDRGRVYSGGGHPDRSGASAVHIGDLTTGATFDIPWGREPCDVIELAGEDRLLVATEVHEMHVGQHPDAHVTLLATYDQSRIWTMRISDLKPGRNPILASVPEEQWALIQTGRLLKRVSLRDGSAVQVMEKRPDEHVRAAWVPSCRLLYVARTPGRGAAGTIEAYQVDTS